MSAGVFKGTSVEQDNRFGDAHKKLLEKTKFPSEFKKKVEISKVNLAVIKPWIANKVTEILGFEDEVVMEFVFTMLEEKTPDPRNMQINLGGFLESKAPEFTLDLWKLLLSAQEGVGGIPEQFIEAKKEEIRKQKEEEARLAQEIRTKSEKLREYRHAEMEEQRARARSRSRSLSRRSERRHRDEGRNTRWGSSRKREKEEEGTGESTYYHREGHERRPYRNRSRSSEYDRYGGRKRRESYNRRYRDESSEERHRHRRGREDSRERRSERRRHFRRSGSRSPSIVSNRRGRRDSSTSTSRNRASRRRSTTK